MKKSLVIHFRISHKLVSTPTIIPGTKKKVNQRILTPFLTTSGIDLDNKGGITVHGVLFDDPFLGMIIKWGVSLCYKENYDRKKGVDQSLEHALNNEYNTRNVSFKNAKEIAKVIANRVYFSGGIEVPMKYLFTKFTDRLPVENSPTLDESMEKIAL